MLPAGLTRRLTRHAVPFTVGVVGLVLLSGLALAALVTPGTLGISAARLSETNTLPETLLANGLSERDSDNDGLSDSLENYLYGTDPQGWNSSGLGIPDGWLAQFGYDPLSPLTAQARGAAPPAAALPAAYRDGYPLEFTPLLKDYYAYGKPASYVPGEGAPWWRTGAHASPSQWDQGGKGIPTGWLLRYGLDPQNVEPDRVATGSLGNLTVREAFTHNTNPLAADSDKDGLDDWTEIRITLTDPGRFSTAGTGAADGWLHHYGLNAFDPDVGSQDPDLDGLTNLEEFVISHETYRAEVEAQGVAVLFRRGLDPLEWETARTGIPDGWYVKYGLSPFGTDVDRVIGRASDFPEIRNLRDAPDGHEPLPDLVFTVRSSYEYARPSDWNESRDGVWWGGTNPATGDSDSDGVPDAIEIRGWYANVTFDTGPEAKPRAYLASSNPLEGDSDGDGLGDGEEYRGRTTCDGGSAARAGATRLFPPTDPRNRDTAFSGLTDFEKVCGAVRGEARYDLSSSEGGAFLDPTRADSAGDSMRDGARLAFWHERADQLKQNPSYPYNGSLYKTVFEWTEKYARFGGLSPDQVLAQFRPDGDADGDGIANVLDADPSGGLFAEKGAPAGTPKTKVFFLGGPQIDPSLYRLTEFASLAPHSASDPANPDTDGDGLPDAWETRYGTFDAALNGWNLDPAKSDSDGDGLPDNKANNDGDVVTWYAYNRNGANTERVTNSFVFDNELEYIAGTNPNDASTAGDGVPDGWKAFWGSRITDGTFPSLLAARDASVGTVALDRASDIESALAASPVNPLANLKGLGTKTTGYVRLFNVTACASATQLAGSLREGEAFPAGFCYAGRNLEGNEVAIARAEGVHRLTYADEARLRTNPFLADSDGDGAPDAYEAHYLVRTPGGTVFPDPAASDGERDADRDGIGLIDECRSADGGAKCGIFVFARDGESFGVGSDPNGGDSDFDGIQDGIEFNAGLNPVDPSDVESFSDPTRDSDKDGVPDYLELTGWGKNEFGVPVRTDPNDPDSDRDGLLDGDTLNLNPGNAAHAARITEYDARGIAHKRLANGTFDYFGERTFGASFGTRPDQLFAAHPEIPDGWLAYYNENPKERTVEPANYLANRPSWWVEKQHGVWWWGRSPTAAATDDADGDGLHDRNGEDPFPATRRLNAIASGATVITDPRDLLAFVESAATPYEARVRAQLAGDGAGDPAAARAAALAAVNPVTGVPVRLDHAKVALVNVTAQSVLSKGASFQVSGRVVLDERTPGGALLEGSETSRVGVANRTVLVSFFTPAADRVVGAGFTDRYGRFNITANITGEQRVAIPAAGQVLLGSVKGNVSLRFDPALVSTGDASAGERNRIVVWVTNTSATARPGDPTHAPHKAWLPNAAGQTAERMTNATGFAASSPISVTVRSTTRLTTTVAATAQNGAKLVGDVSLLDASGAPIVDKVVVLRWTGSTSPVEVKNVSTDRNGRVNVTNLGIPVGVERPDQYALTASFASTDPNLNATNATFPVVVRNPTRILAELDREGYTVGETVTVTGNASTLDVRLPDGRTLPAAPVANAAIRVTLGGAEEAAQADASGRFSVRIVVPGSLPAGSQSLTVKLTSAATTEATDTSLPLGVKRTSALVDLTRVEGPRTIDVALRGRLVDNEGQGFAGAIEVRSTLGTIARGAADETGAFRVIVPLAGLPLGGQGLTVAFPGDAGHAAASNFTQARVTSSTRILLEDAPREIVRGESFAATARLVDDRAGPVAGQPVAVHWRGERLAVAVTDAGGVVSYRISTNASERPSVSALGLEYVPSANAPYQPATVGASVRIVAGSILELPAQSVARGPVTVSGRLLDDEERPITAGLVTIRVDGALFGEVRTARNGSFELSRALPADAKLGNLTVGAYYAGTSTIAGDALNVTWKVRSPLVLGVSALGAFIRGEETLLEGRLADDRGKPLTATFTASLGGRDIGVVTAKNGLVKQKLAVPADLERGATTFRLRAPATDEYDAFERDLPVIVKIRPKVEVELPAVAVRGFSVGGDVHLVDDRGEPLRNTSFAYTLGAGRSAVTGQTDAEGKAVLASVAPLTGDAVLALTVRGGGDVVAAQYQASSMRVVGPATPIAYAGLALAVLAVLAIAGLVVAAALLRRRQIEEAREIIEEAIRDLLAGNEYAGTVFLAYRRFGAYLARHGFAEKASDTPREFAAGVRKALPIGAVSLRELIQLFEEARYSDHAIGSNERDRAVESLASVRNELDALLGSKKVIA